MGQRKDNTHPRKGKYLNRDERMQIEVLLKRKARPSQIARLLGRVMCVRFIGRSGAGRMGLGFSAP